MSPEPVESASPARAPGRKSVLFCPECRHESPVDGNWRVRAGADGDVLVCPVCGATVTIRPTEETRDASHGFIPPTDEGWCD